MVHSICSWGEGSPWKWASAVAHLWRTTGDICIPGQPSWENAIEIVFSNEKLYQWAGPGHWNDPDMMIVGMPGLSEAQNRSLFSLWCMMASPLIAGNDLRKMSKSTLDILTNLEAISINQDPLGIQGHIIRKDGQVSIWADKPLFDGSQAVLVFNLGTSPSEVHIKWSEIGINNQTELYLRDLWKHETKKADADGICLKVPSNDVAFLRVSRFKDFPLPPIISADKYLISFRVSSSSPQILSDTITIYNHGSTELPLWRTRKETVPSWLSVEVVRSGKNQVIINKINTAGMKKGSYQAIIRLDNTEPISKRPMSLIYYDVDLELMNDVKNY